MKATRVIAITVCEATETGVMAAADLLGHSGWKAQLFDVADQGGAAYEAFLSRREAAGALDYTLHDLAEQRLRGLAKAGRNRLTTAATQGIPQVIVPGGLDFVAFRSRLPPGYEGRPRHAVNASVTLVRTIAEDNDAFGKDVAFKASASKGPVTIIVPRGGFSEWDGLRRPLDAPSANQTFLDSLFLWKSPEVQVVESDRHINDYLFAQIAAERLLKMLASHQPGWRK